MAHIKVFVHLEISKLPERTSHTRVFLHVFLLLFFYQIRLLIKGDKQIKSKGQYGTCYSR